MTVLLIAVVLAAEPVRVPGDEVASTLEQAVSGITAHLDRDAVSGGKRTARSFFALPETLGGGKYTFSIPDQTLDMGSMGRVTYRLNDVNLSKTTVKTKAGDYLVSLFFEDDGREVLAQHEGGMFNLGGAVPDLQMNQMRLDVALTPEQGGDSPRFSKAKTSFDADIKPDGSGGSLAGALDSSTNYKRQIKDAITQQCQRSIDELQLVDALNEQLVALTKGRPAHFEGTDLVYAREAEAKEPEKPPAPAPKKKH